MFDTLLYFIAFYIDIIIITNTVFSNHRVHFKNKYKGFHQNYHRFEALGAFECIVVKGY